MQMTPQEAIDHVNEHVAETFVNPLIKKTVELAVAQFVQQRLDDLVARGHLDVQLKFDVGIDPVSRNYFAILRGTF